MLAECGVMGLKSQMIKIKEFPIFPKGKGNEGWVGQGGVGEKEPLRRKRERPEDGEKVREEEAQAGSWRGTAETDLFQNEFDDIASIKCNGNSVPRLPTYCPVGVW